MDKYLDITKSVIISSPAGSGKTEKLSRRYIELLRSGTEVEKILAITFTERAAAEMKERILRILRAEDPQLLARIAPKVPLMRISTIHAFCLRLLRRFSLELGLDPAASVADELEAREMWLEALYGSLKDEGAAATPLFNLITDRGIKGWDALMRVLEQLHSKRPYPEMMLKAGAAPEGEAGALLKVYGQCLGKYKAMKAERRLLDFEDLEMLAHEALSRGPEWHNILYAFDEHTEHILVDEFQDTNTLQWKIIEKLTEEWRAGRGAQREGGKTPTIFLVGDEKQSIYQFRGANVSIFHETKDNFERWLGQEHHYVEAVENYRSLPAIVDFVNTLFSVIMPRGLGLGWMTQYTPFEAQREGKGGVDLVMLEAGPNTKETRSAEARALARTIRGHHAARREVYDEQTGLKRPCRFGDMAVLIRKRTHLGVFEDAMRAEGVPFVVLKGIGFYDTPETAALRELVSYIVDPSDEYSLFALLRSPLFGIDYGNLTKRFRSRHSKKKAQAVGKIEAAEALLKELHAEAAVTPLSVLLERALVATGAWEHYWERQRHGNIKKFISLVESYEAQGLSNIEIREKLLRHRHQADLAKANINPEGMDAVRVLTIHAAKGLQFPMVFIPSLEESISPTSGPVVVDDDPGGGGGIVFSLEEDPRARATNEVFRTKKLKLLEEEKRLFYVALTRARDYVCMLASPKNGKATGRLGYLKDAFGPLAPGSDNGMLLRVLGPDDIADLAGGVGVEFTDIRGFANAPAYTEALRYEPKPLWRDVTAGEPHFVKGHGEEWTVTGRVMHKLLEEISKGRLREVNITERAEELLAAEPLRDKEIIKTILGDIWKLKRVGLLDEVVSPLKDSYTELDFVLKRGNTNYKGRIDRVIIKNGKANVYDYKCFPATEAEIPALVERYSFQLSIYKEAAQKLFKVPARAYLLFTNIPKVLQI